MLELVSQHEAGESGGTFKRWGLVKAHGKWGLCLWRRGGLQSIALFPFAHEANGFALPSSPTMMHCTT